MHRALILLIALVTSNLTAQNTFFPLGNDSYQYLERLQVKYGKHLPNHFTTVKPYSSKLATEIIEYTEFEDTNDMRLRAKDRLNHQYIMKEASEWNERGEILSKKPVLKHFYKYKTSFLYEKGENYAIKIDPVLNLQVGFDQDIYRFINSRGIVLRGWLGKKVGFYTQFSDNQARFAQYVNDYVFDNNAIPGEGRFFLFEQGTGQRDSSWDYLMAAGYLTFSPIDEIQITFGTDEHFIGDGMRSLILSDFSNRYPFIKLETKFGRFQYVNIFAELTQRFDTLGDQVFQKKMMALHHLNFQVSNWLSIGLFESVIIDSSDRGLRLEYFNPVILYRWVEHNTGSPDNVILGFDWRAKLHTSGLLYGQIVLDEFNFGSFLDNDGSSSLKYAYQVGLKWIDIADVANLDLNLEYNRVRPFTYSHSNETNAYTHFNAPLAHPLESNFSEVLFEIRYKPIHKLQLRLTGMFANKGFDIGDVNYGGDIFADLENSVGDTGNEVGQGDNTDIVLFDAEASYMLRHNLSIDLGLTRRNFSPEIAEEQSSTYPYIGLRLNAPRKKFIF